MYSHSSSSISLLNSSGRQLLVLVIAGLLASAVIGACDAPAASPTPTAVVAVATVPPAAATATAPPAPTKPPTLTAVPSPAALTVEQLMAEAIRATNAAQTLKYDMVMRQEISITGGPKPMAISMAMDGAGSANLAKKEMQMNTTMNVDVPEQGKQKILMQMYIVGPYAYLKMVIPGEADQWMKMPFTDEIWRDQIQIDRQMALLESATQLRITGTENVGGVQTHVVEVTPDIQAAFDLLGQGQVPGMEELDVSKFGAIGDLFKDTTVRYWISKDRKLLTKVEMHMAGELASSTMGAAAAGFGNMTMDINVTVNCAFDQPVSIVLPQEALAAPEVSSHAH